MGLLEFWDDKNDPLADLEKSIGVEGIVGTHTYAKDRVKPPTKRGSVLGTSFLSGDSSIDQNQVTIDPRITEQKERGLGMTQDSILATQKARADVLGGLDSTAGLKKGVEAERQALNTRLQKTGVGGAFGAQSRESFEANAKQKMASGEAMAFDEFMSVANTFDAMEKQGISLNEMVRQSNFAQEAQARGMSSDLLAKLNRIDLDSEADFQARKAGGQAGAGNALSGLLSIFSSHTYKYDKTPLDNQVILDKMMELDVESWKYNDTDETHIGCYAEDFNERFGIEGEKTINVVDIIGVLMASIQAQQKQIEELKCLNH